MAERWELAVNVDYPAMKRWNKVEKNSPAFTRPACQRKPSIQRVYFGVRYYFLGLLSFTCFHDRVASSQGAGHQMLFFGFIDRRRLA